LFAFHTRKAFEKIVQGFTALDLIKEILDRDPCSIESGCATHPFGVDTRDPVERAAGRQKIASEFLKS
jgi:hypothetical protein